MLTTAGKTLATARTAGSAAGSAWAKQDTDRAHSNATKSILGSARASRAGDRAPAIAHFSPGDFRRGRRKRHARARALPRVRWTIFIDSWAASNETLSELSTCCADQS